MPKNKPSHKIPEGEPKGPSSPEEAREWLESAALHLLTWPIASHRFRFVGWALLQYLKGDRKGDRELRHALGLLPRGDVRKPGPRGVSDENIRSIARMLRDGTPFKDIHAAVEVSPKFVQLVRADLHALIRFHDIEEQKADKRVSAIPKARRDAILLGIVDADMDMKSLDPDPRSTPAPSF